MGKPHTVCLYTNRNVAVWDEEGNPLSEDQSTITCYHIDQTAASLVLEQAQVFWIAKWRDWMHAISRKEMQYLLGLRTREMDLKEIDQQVGRP